MVPTRLPQVAGGAVSGEKLAWEGATVPDAHVLCFVEPMMTGRRTPAS